MLTVEAIYDNGKITLLEKPRVKKARILITFLDDAPVKTPSPQQAFVVPIIEASEQDVEYAAASDTGEDYLSEEEVAYYLKLEER